MTFFCAILIKFSFPQNSLINFLGIITSLFLKIDGLPLDSQ